MKTEGPILVTSPYLDSFSLDIKWSNIYTILLKKKKSVDSRCFFFYLEFDQKEKLIKKKNEEL